MRAARLLPVPALALLVSSCVFIVRPDDGNTPNPVPVPLTCTIEEGQATAHVYFSVRIERSTVNMVDAYSAFMSRVVIALAGAGINTTQAVLVRADERPGGAPLLAAWGCRLDSPEQLSPENVLHWYATQEELQDEPLGCVTDPLARLGAGLNEVVTQYPRNLGGTNGLSVFGSAPDVALVVHIDPLPRRSGYDAAECASARGLSEVAPDGTAAWLRYAGDDLPVDRVVHWLVYTPEGVDRSTFVESCRAHEGFPSHLLDLIEPSALRVYDPLFDALNGAGGDPQRADFCRILSDDRAVLAAGAVDVAGRIGLSVPEDQIKDVLEGGLPSPDDLIEDPVEGDRPPG